MDDPFSPEAEALRREFEARACHLQIACSILQFEAAIKNEWPDFILIQHLQPGMAGDLLVHEIRRRMLSFLSFFELDACQRAKILVYSRQTCPASVVKAGADLAVSLDGRGPDGILEVLERWAGQRDRR